MDLESTLFVSSTVVLGLTTSYILNIGSKRWNEKRKEELHTAMGDVPEEHRASVGKVLNVLQAQHYNETVGYRIRNLLRNYNLVP